VTITLVLAAVFVPVAFMPGMTWRIYNDFAMTIVLSFVFPITSARSGAISRAF
jgi:multidrug efflux pump subunit AcrB